MLNTGNAGVLTLRIAPLPAFFSLSLIFKVLLVTMLYTIVRLSKSGNDLIEIAESLARAGLPVDEGLEEYIVGMSYEGKQIFTIINIKTTS